MMSAVPLSALRGVVRRVQPPPRPAALCVHGYLPDQCRAGLELIRPDETDALVRQVLNGPHRRAGHGLACSLAACFREMFDARIIAYQSDPIDPVHCPDLWRSPQATLANGGGDCDCLALLATSAARRLGLDATLAVGALRGVGHAWCEIVERDVFFLLEATNGELHWGHRPPGYVSRLYVTQHGCTYVTTPQ